MADNEKANRCNEEVVEVEPLKALLTINWLLDKIKMLLLHTARRTAARPQYRSDGG